MTSSLPARPIEVTTETSPFWDATTEGKLVLPRCVQCGTTIWYPKGFCPSCASSTVEWLPTSGAGTVYSFSVTRKGAGVWAEHSPYVIAYVELEEGPRVLTISSIVRSTRSESECLYTLCLTRPKTDLLSTGSSR